MNLQTSYTRHDNMGGTGCFADKAATLPVCDSSSTHVYCTRCNIASSICETPANTDGTDNECYTPLESFPNYPSSDNDAANGVTFDGAGVVTINGPHECGRFNDNCFQGSVVANVLNINDVWALPETACVNENQNTHTYISCGDVDSCDLTSYVSDTDTTYVTSPKYPAEWVLKTNTCVRSNLDMVVRTTAAQDTTLTGNPQNWPWNGIGMRWGGQTGDKVNGGSEYFGINVDGPGDGDVSMGYSNPYGKVKDAPVQTEFEVYYVRHVEMADCVNGDCADFIKDTDNRVKIPMMQMTFTTSTETR